MDASPFANPHRDESSWESFAGPRVRCPGIVAWRGVLYRPGSAHSDFVFSSILGATGSNKHHAAG